MTTVDQKKLDRSLEKMATRTKYVQEHVRRTHEVYSAWARLEYEEASCLIREIITFLTANKHMFPNYQAHMDTWGTLLHLSDNIEGDNSV